MLRRWIASIAVLISGAGVAVAQPSPVALSAIVLATEGAESQARPNVVLENACSDCASSRFWFRGEYLLWRVKDAPAPIPLISANPNPLTIAALDEPGTTILFGEGSGQSTGFGWFSGVRLTLGGWIDDEQLFGWEIGGFMLERRSNLFNAASGGGGARVVAIPVNATEPFGLVNPAGETTQNSFGFPNQISAHLNSRLWGMEANGVVNLWQSESFQLIGLVGFRYLDLVENLSLNDAIGDAATQGFLSVTDGFNTRNQFYGGQIGVRAGITRGRWNVDTTAKIAFGSTHQVMSIVGATESTQGAFGFPTGVTNAGAFAEPSNIGRFDRDVFAVIPEVQFTLAYQLNENLRPFIGYNFMYLSNAARPGEQMDRNINLTQNPLANLGAPVTGALSPLPIFRSGDFWAQGINFGVELRY